MSGPWRRGCSPTIGAEVIKIEDRTRIDTPRKLPIYKDEPARNFGEEAVDADPDRGGLFNNYCRNKLGVVINMRTPKGRQLAERLIAESSVVSENFAPGVMERWGLTYERLQELSPDVIYARMSGYGHSGPHAEYRSYGPVVQAMSGLTHISGLPGREPSGWGFSYMDNQAAYYNSTALLMAIYQRMRTGQGTEIDVSAIENGINLVGPVLLDVTVNGHTSRRPDFPTGNRLEWPPAAPHGVYPAQWRGPLGRHRRVRRRPVGRSRHCARKPRHGPPTRVSPRRRIGSGTRTPSTSTCRLGHVTATATTSWSCCSGMACRRGPCRTPKISTRRDPQVAHRGVFFEMDHPVIGPARFEGTPVQFSSIAQDNWRSGPLLGEDNEYVFKQIVGVDDDEFDELRRTRQAVI